MKTKAPFVAALSLFLAFGALAQMTPRAPQPAMAPAPHGQMLGPARIAQFLDLSDGQVDQVKALRAKLGETLRPLHAQQKANREAVEAAVNAGDATKAGQALIAGKALREQIKAALDAHRAAFGALLTPAQKAKWDVYQELSELRGKRRHAPAAAPAPPRR